MDNFFSEKGVLSKLLPGYEPRIEQQKMSKAIANALNSGEHLIVEAGTGVGKSLAYLIPLIKWVLDDDGVRDASHVTVKQIVDTDMEYGYGIRTRRSVVSTYTKTLQRQLIEKELPFLRDHIFKDLRFALCLGSENYICRRRLEQAKAHGLFDMDEIDAINSLLGWVNRTSTGVRSEIDVKQQTWQKVCRESDLCYGKDCKKFDKCFYQKAKRIERKAHILITNHHLFFANVSSGWSVLPAFDAVVFDEAHELEDVAADYLGIEISNFKLKHLLDSILSLHGKGLLSRLTWLSQNRLSKINAILNAIRIQGDAFFNELSEVLKDSTTFRIRKAGFIKDDLSDTLMSLTDTLKMLQDVSKDDDEKKEINALALRSEAFVMSLQLILRQELKDHVYWVQRDGKRLRLAATPIDIASILRTQVFDTVSTAILTSATLSTNGNFDYIKERLGLNDVKTLLLHSPFDFKKQALLYIPEDLREPKSKGFEDDLINHLKEILEVTMGRTLVLFTSYSLLEKASEAIDIAGVRILKQGDMDSYRLLQEFRADKNSALFGTYTFWQGIDVPGDNLQCVIITKLPFAVPDEPVIEARMEAIERYGKNPFIHYQIPQAIIMLKQGFGRLIRTKTDKGAVVILDSRIRTKGYGMHFLNSLPECKIGKLLVDIKGFV